MIDYVFDLYAPVVERFILVLHPAFAQEVQRYCAGHTLPLEYAVQESPTGMLDAILIPYERVHHYQPTSVWITWCDQIAVHPRTVTCLATLSAADPEAAVILPTITRVQPYVHLVRNAQQDIIDILHQREGDVMPAVGEGDMGLFCLSRTAYLDLLMHFSCTVGQGSVTHERNFLPFIPWLAGRARVRTFPGQDEIESIGVNTLDDVRRLEQYLRHA
jgi:bifunctional N-acetylglucosamine-1-phosphate-uridyltransferase/glucosamine-1-phosphate-acetyltransferase GlmU-like protein